MLTQGPTPDPKCELNIISFLTLPHPLHCLICAKDIMVAVLLLQVMEGMGRLGAISFMLGFVWRTGGGYHIFFLFFVLFLLLLLIVLSWLVHDSLFCLFHCSFFAFSVCGPFN